MPATPEELRRLAALAALDLDDEELVRFTEQVNAMLKRADALAGLEPAEESVAHDSPTRCRDDTVDPDPLAAPPATFAPSWVDGFFVVPRGEVGPA